jgi:ferredoxin-NADP reductase/sterol desaturase/sphingolipid hydroxylase (fatty acid hydroxylase superfamily)
LRIQLVQRCNSEQVREEIKNQFISLLVLALYITAIILLGKNGITKTYTDINLYGGLWYAIVTFILLIIVDDTWFYWSHRFMHNPKIYKYIHALHHKSLDVNPFSGFSFHVFEVAALFFWLIPFSIIIPIYLPVIAIFAIYAAINNVIGRLGYELYPKWFEKTWLKYKTNSTHHNLHHTKYNGNYALHFRFWDIVCGTEFAESEAVVHEIQNRTDAVIKLNNKYISLKISKIVKETSDVCSMYFNDVPAKFFDYYTGQYINLRVKIEGQNYDRVFSLSSSPTEDKFLRITMKLNGMVTNHIFNDAKVGDIVEAFMPLGDFYIHPNPNNSTNYLFVAGGSGITPIFSMIKTVLSKEPKSKVTLFYANRSEESTIFAKEISELENKFDQFKVVNFISGKRRLDKKTVQEFIENHSNPQIYLCGPAGLKLAIKSYLKECSVHINNIHDEEFADAYVKLIPNFFQKRTKSI